MGKKNKGTPQNVEPVQEEQVKTSQVANIMDDLNSEIDMTEDEQIEDLFDRSEHPPKGSNEEEPKTNESAEAEENLAAKEEADARAAQVKELTAKVQSAIINVRQNQSSLGVTVLRTVIAKVLGKKPASVSLDKSGSISIETAEGLKLKV